MKQLEQQVAKQYISLSPLTSRNNETVIVAPFGQLLRGGNDQNSKLTPVQLMAVGRHQNTGASLIQAQLLGQNQYASVTPLQISKTSKAQEATSHSYK